MTSFRLPAEKLGDATTLPLARDACRISEFPDRALKPEELARLYSCSTKTLANWRVSGRGPPFVSMNGRAIRYMLVSSLEWLNSQTKRSTSDSDESADSQS